MFVVKLNGSKHFSWLRFFQIFVSLIMVLVVSSIKARPQSNAQIIRSESDVRPDGYDFA